MKKARKKMRKKKIANFEKMRKKFFSNFEKFAKIFFEKNAKIFFANFEKNAKKIRTFTLSLADLLDAFIEEIKAFFANF